MLRFAHQHDIRGIPQTGSESRLIENTIVQQ
jgi:hypothetical protein